MTWPWRGFSPSAWAGPMEANASAAARVLCLIFMAVSSSKCIYSLFMRAYIRLFGEDARSMRDFEFTFRCFKVAEDLATPHGVVLRMAASDVRNRNFRPSSSISYHCLVATNAFRTYIRAYAR